MRFKGVLVALLSLLLAVLFPGCALNDKNHVRIGVLRWLRYSNPVRLT